MKASLSLTTRLATAYSAGTKSGRLAERGRGGSDQRAAYLRAAFTDDVPGRGDIPWSDPNGTKIESRLQLAYRMGLAAHCVSIVGDWLSVWPRINSEGWVQTLTVAGMVLAETPITSPLPAEVRRGQALMAHIRDCLLKVEARAEQALEPSEQPCEAVPA